MGLDEAKSVGQLLMAVTSPKDYGSRATTLGMARTGISCVTQQMEIFPDIND